MSGAGVFDRQMLEVALSEIETVRRTLPEDVLSALAQEVVQRVAVNLRASLAADFIFSSQDVESLCAALLSDDPHAAVGLFEKAHSDGYSYDALCLSYLAVAAQRLGERWENDQTSFYRVTVAAGRIYAILRILRLGRATATPDLRRSAIFASVPGENHTLGITIAADLARDRGWDIELFVGLSHDELVQTLEQRQPSLIGLSASGKRSLPALTKLIVALRISHPDTHIPVSYTHLTLPTN